MVMPGVGFDVVPSDCLASTVADALPEAVRLDMAFRGSGGVSRGTMKTMIEQLGQGTTVRRGGRLETVDAGSLVRTVVLGGKPRTVAAISWGDVSTAYHSTGIGDITVSMAMPAGQIRGMKIMTMFAGLLRRPAVIRALQKIVEKTRTGPTEDVRGRSHMDLWAQATAADGRTVEAWLRTPEGYTTTVITALLCVRKVLAGEANPGYQTPSSAFGAGLIKGLHRSGRAGVWTAERGESGGHRAPIARPPGCACGRLRLAHENPGWLTYWWGWGIGPEGWLTGPPKWAGNDQGRLSSYRDGSAATGMAHGSHGRRFPDTTGPLDAVSEGLVGAAECPAGGVRCAGSRSSLLACSLWCRRRWKRWRSTSGRAWAACWPGTSRASPSAPTGACPGGWEPTSCL